MLRITVRTVFYGALAISIAVALSTVVRSAPQAATENLQTRFEAYWQARVQNNMPLALQYEHPKQRKQLGAKISQARLRSGVNVTAFSVVDPQAFQLDPTAQEARVEMRLQYEYTFPSMDDRKFPVSTVVADVWQKEQGVWYHVLQTEVGS